MSERKGRKPYISVTGVTNLQEARTLTKTFNRSLSPESSHQGAMGFLVTSRTLEGINPRPSKFPCVSELPILLAGSKDTALNIIHYNTKNREGLAGQVTKLFGLDNIYRDKLCRALQLNVRWPDVNQVDAIRSALPELQIILPLTPRILRRQTREEIAESIGKYENLIDFILIDPSGGRGTTFEASWVAPYYRLLKYYYPEKQIIVAGGFNESNLTLRLVQITHALMSGNFGIDAESGLRDKAPGDHYGRLSLTRAVQFIEKASGFFSPANDLASQIESSS